jgi:hypothetical protein
VYNGAWEGLRGGVDVSEDQSCTESEGLNLGDLSVGVLEEVFADLMIIKYPGVEQADVVRLLGALNAGDLGLVEQIEADIAEKSARWMRAVLDVDG